MEPEKRGIGIVFQSYALFPTMTVFDNIAFGLKVKKVAPDVIKAKVSAVAAKLRSLINSYSVMYQNYLGSTTKGSIGSCSGS